MTEPREALAALREAWHEEDQAEAQMSVAYYDGEKREAERRLTSARGAAREAEAAAGVHLGDEGLRRPQATGYGTDGDVTVKAIRWPDHTFTVERLAGDEGLRALSEAATPGPWFGQAILVHGPDRGGFDIGPALGWHDWSDADARFIVAAVNYVRAALAAQENPT